MKFKSIITTICAAVCCTISSCSKDAVDIENQNISILFEDSEIVFSPESSTNKISLYSDYSFTLELDCDWIALDKYDGVAGENEFDLTIQENDTDEDRVAYLIITRQNESQIESVTITLTQTDGLSITSFVFEKSKNSVLSSDVECAIEGREITVLISELSEYVDLTPTFGGSFYKVKIDDVQQKSGVTSNNFDSERLYTTISKTGKSRTYSVKVFIYSAIPIVRVNTTGGVSIVDKETYVEGEVSISKTPQFSSSSLTNEPMRIKGRGNATWNYAKKPYKIKLDSKAVVLDMPKEKDWVLLAEYCDKSLLRNSYGFEFARLMELPYYSKSHHVELFVNSEYLGTYLLCEHIEDGDDRINVSSDGFIIERDNYWAQEPLYFQSSNGIYYTFKYPDTDDIDESSEEYIYTKNYMDQVESALNSDNFDDASDGYAKYIDTESFAKWFIIQNVLGNMDPNLYYVLYNRSSKLQTGPIWDMEWSLGLTANGDNGWATPPAISPIDEFYHIGSSAYFARLLEDSAFKEGIKSVWNRYKASVIPALNESMSAKAKNIEYSQKLNFDRWDILGKYISVGLVAFDTWEEEVAYTADFLQQRVDWFDGEVNNW